MNSQVPLSSPALSAFIRGIERRALVVAEFQSGEVMVAERAVAVAMRAFVPAAAERPMAEWPSHFWGLLASTPLLRQPAIDGTWPQDLAHLAVLAEGERLALLLRIGAGLDEPTAAAVLGVDVAAYQQALALACPRDAAGHPDAQAWRELAESVQQRVRDLSALRLEQLDRLRESLVTETVAIEAGESTGKLQDEFAEVSFADDRTRRRTAGNSARKRSGLGQWLWLLLGAMVLAGLIWGWMNHEGSAASSPDAGKASSEEAASENPVSTESLQELPLPPPAEPLPPAPLPEDAEASLSRDADFYAWVAAGSPLPVDESGNVPVAAQALALNDRAGR